MGNSLPPGSAGSGIGRAYALALEAGLSSEAIHGSAAEFKQALTALAGRAEARDKLLLAAIRALEKHAEKEGFASLQAATAGIQAARKLAQLAPRAGAGAWSSPPAGDLALRDKLKQSRSADVPAPTALMAMGQQSAIHGNSRWQQRVYFDLWPRVDAEKVRPLILETLRRINDGCATRFNIPAEVQFAVPLRGQDLSFRPELGQVYNPVAFYGSPANPEDPAWAPSFQCTLAHEYGHALLSENLPALAARLCPGGRLDLALEADAHASTADRPKLMREYLSQKVNELKYNRDAYVGAELEALETDGKRAQEMLAWLDETSSNGLETAPPRGPNALARPSSSTPASGLDVLVRLKIVTRPFQELFADTVAVLCAGDREAVAKSLEFFNGQDPTAPARSFVPTVESQDESDYIIVDKRSLVYELLAPTRRHLGALLFAYSAGEDRQLILEAVAKAAVLEMESLLGLTDSQLIHAFTYDGMELNRRFIARIDGLLGK